MMDKNTFREIVQSCHLNFLIGSGASAPLLSTLGNIENYITQLESKDIDPVVKKVALTSLLKSYFDLSMSKNTELLGACSDPKAKSICENYSGLVRSISEVVLHRRTSLLNKQVNLFTTNMDVFFEKCLEESGIEFNDGFSGTLNPTFKLSNFKKSILKTSSHYDNTSEVPLLNIFKIHGSLTWKMIDDSVISLDRTLSTVEALKNISIPSAKIVELDKEVDDGSGGKKKVFKTIDELIEEAKKVGADPKHDEFLKKYDELVIVNPTKEKFKFTTLNYTYYELLRMYSNALEKENTVLFVMGFSFADEHIKEITMRALNANPTLVVCIFGYDSASDKAIKANLSSSSHPTKYNNLKFMSRRSETTGGLTTEKSFDLREIDQSFFGDLARELEKSFGGSGAK